MTIVLSCSRQLFHFYPIRNSGSVPTVSLTESLLDDASFYPSALHDSYLCNSNHEQVEEFAIKGSYYCRIDKMKLHKQYRNSVQKTFSDI